MKNENLETVVLFCGKKRTFKSLANELEKENSINFLTENFYYSCWWSDSNNGWYYVLYQLEDIQKDDDGNFELIDIDSEFEFDGGLCTGSAFDAIEMMLN